MKDIINKRFWFLFLFINVATLCIFLGIAYLNWALLTGYLVGVISFLIFLSGLHLVFKKMNDWKENASIKKNKNLAVIIFLILNFLALLIIALFVIFNLLYKNKHSNANVAFVPFNVITMAIPYTLFSLQIIIMELIKKITTKRNLKRREENG